MSGAQVSSGQEQGTAGTGVSTSDVARVRAVLGAHGYRAGTVHLLGAGLDHVSYAVDGRFVVRFAHDADRGAEQAREGRFLRRLAGIAPVPVPEPVMVDDGCLVYRLLPGVPLLEADAGAHRPEVVGATLGRLLAVLHGEPPHAWADLVEEDETEPAAWLDDAAALFAAVAGHVPPDHRATIGTFLADPPPSRATRPVLCHNDLGIEHVLVDPANGAVTGVIDWSDAALTDPARDLGLVHRDLGARGLEAAVGAYRSAGADPAGLMDRAVFYARCGAIEDLAYGLETDRSAYAVKSLAALEWLFPPDAGPPLRGAGAHRGA